MALNGMLGDNAARYGLVSRIFHWFAAYLILWQFLTVLAWRIFGDTPAVRTFSTFGPDHGAVGVLILVIVGPRMAWAIANRRRRPPKSRGAEGLAARAVHGTFYALMVIVPALALARAYGKGEGYAPWGIQLIPVAGHETPWLIAPADLLHSPLSWLLSALIAGHVTMAVANQYLRGKPVLSHMAGSLRTGGR